MEWDDDYWGFYTKDLKWFKEEMKRFKVKPLKKTKQITPRPDEVFEYLSLDRTTKLKAFYDSYYERLMKNKG